MPISKLVKESLEKSFSINIDIVDTCNLRCVHCPRGVYYQKNTSEKMELGVFKDILDKLTYEGSCHGVDMFNWAESFLHPEIDKFVEAVKSKKLACNISTNLSFNLPGRLEAVLMHTPGLIVSVSGFSQKMQELYHKGSNLEFVKNNLKFISELREKHKLPLRVDIHCLEFNDNQEDQALWKKYCNDYGFIYKSKPAFGSEVTSPETAGRLLHKPSFFQDSEGNLKVHQSHLSKMPSTKTCMLHNTISIGPRGDVYLCCIYWYHDKYRIGNFLKTSLRSIQERRLSHLDCLHCSVLKK